MLQLYARCLGSGNIGFVRIDYWLLVQQRRRRPKSIGTISLATTSNAECYAPRGV